MRGRAFLRASHHLVTNASEPCWRSAIVQGYYALFLECRDMLTGWGVVLPPRHQPHFWVRQKLQFATDADLKQLGNMLERLLRLRNRASYDLGPSPAFSSEVDARQSIRDVEDSLDLLDAIEADSSRRALAIASLPP